MASTISETLTKTTREILTNKYVLYVLLFMATMNVLAFVATDNFISLAVFALIGLLVSYFTKNMTMVLIVTLLTSSFLHITRKTVEGITNKVTNKDTDDETDTDDDDEVNDHVKKPKKTAINHQKTVSKAYENAQSVLGNGNFKQMSNDAAELMKNQEALTESLQSIAPLIKNAGSVLDKFDMGEMSNMIGKLGGMNLGGKKKNNT